MQAYFTKNLLSHLLELRKRFIRILVVVGIFFLILFPFSSVIFHQFALPLLNQITPSHSLIATTLTGAFFSPIKLCFVLAFFIGMPFILHQIWGFIAPALYSKERLVSEILLIGSTLLFYSGVFFAYFLIFPTIMAFLVHIAPPGVAVTPDITAYLSFSLRLLTAFGLAFEIPAIMFLLVRSRWISTKALEKKRRYVIVLNFTISMMLTPDVISQVSLAIPMCLLFELGLLVCKKFNPPTHSD